MKPIRLATILFLCNMYDANGMYVDEKFFQTSDPIKKSDITVLDTVPKVVDFFERANLYIASECINEMFSLNTLENLILFVQKLEVVTANPDCFETTEDDYLEFFINKYEANWKAIKQYLNNLNRIKKFIGKNGNDLARFLVSFSSCSYYYHLSVDIESFHEERYDLIQALAWDEVDQLEALREIIMKQINGIDVSNANIIYKNYRIFIRSNDAEDREIFPLDESKLKNIQANKSEEDNKKQNSINEIRANKKEMR